MAAISTEISIQPTELVVRFKAKEHADRIVDLGSCVVPRRDIGAYVDGLMESQFSVEEDKWNAVRGVLVAIVQGLRQELLEYNLPPEVSGAAEGS